MALIHAHFWSEALQKQSALCAIVPDQGNGPFPVYYLLHGLSDDHTIWLRRTRIDSYVSEIPLIVVMPDGHRSFYADHVSGPAYSGSPGLSCPGIETQIRVGLESSGHLSQSNTLRMASKRSARPLMFRREIVPHPLGEDPLRAYNRAKELRFGHNAFLSRRRGLRGPTRRQAHQGAAPS